MHSILEILSESTGSAGPDLISLDDLKLALGITGTTEDAALQAAITMQSRLIAEYCDRRFGLAEALETFTFDRGEIILQRQALVLSLYPVSAISEVSAAGATDADYELDSESGRLWPGGTTSWWPAAPIESGVPYQGKISITYSGGYDLPEDAPARLQRAVIECVSSVRSTSAGGYRDPTIREVQHGDVRISYVSPSFASGAISTGQHFSPSVVDLINPFRRRYIA
jgi:hypothetical protein